VRKMWKRHLAPTAIGPYEKGQQRRQPGAARAKPYLGAEIQTRQRGPAHLVAVLAIPRPRCGHRCASSSSSSSSSSSNCGGVGWDGGDGRGTDEGRTRDGRGAVGSVGKPGAAARGIAAPGHGGARVAASSSSPGARSGVFRMLTSAAHARAAEYGTAERAEAKSRAVSILRSCLALAPCCVSVSFSF
jgi:hypothetical protein